MKRGVLLALLSALLFGATLPISKTLFAEISPVVLTGLLHLGAGVATSFALPQIFRHLRERRNGWFLIGLALSGAVVGPLCLFYGLRVTSSSVASILLNLESPFTAAIAVVIFRDRLSARVLIAIGLALIAALVVSYAPVGWANGALGGAGLVTVAALAWAFDNNFTGRLSFSAPEAVVAFKGLCGGIFTLTLALVTRAPWPTVRGIFAPLAWGAVGFGISLVVYVRALERLGPARTSLIFSAAPFIGAVLSIVFLHEPLSWRLFAGGALFALAVWLLLSEKSAENKLHS